MLISFPFLSTPQPKTDDDRNDGTFGLGEKSGKGSFPVSYQFGWHGGVHLVAPGDDKNPEPVRAIADGEVVFARPCTPQPKQDPTEEERDDYPLFYYAGWTSNGVVILKHRTEIGEGVEVIFYSIYQHLKVVANKSGAQEALKTGDKVYRKDPIGQAGNIYGRPCPYTHLSRSYKNQGLTRAASRERSMPQKPFVARRPLLQGVPRLCSKNGQKDVYNDMTVGPTASISRSLRIKQTWRS